MDPFTAFLVIAGGLLGGAVSVQNWQNNNESQNEQVQDQLDLMDAEFQQDKDDAIQSAKNSLESAELSRLSAKESIDSANASILSAENNKIAADDSDKEITLSEAVLGNSVNNQIDSLQQNAHNNAIGYNASSMQAGSTAGSAYAASAASGTRGSSAVQAAAINQENAQASLQAQENSDRLSDSLTLQSVMNSAQEQVLKNNSSRTANNATRAEADASITTANDAITVANQKITMADSQTQQAYDTIESYQTADENSSGKDGSRYLIYQKQRSNYEKANTADDSFWAGLSSFFSGFGSGAKTTSSVAEWTAQWL